MSDEPLITLKVKNERGDLIMPRGFFDDVVVANMKAIQRVRDLHQPIQTSGALGSVTHCSHCTRLIGENPKIYMAFHPCETIKALDNKQHED